jgi:hypothetical protein
VPCDSDEDGVVDFDETTTLRFGSLHLDPELPDTDDDGEDDKEEVRIAWEVEE